ncbi:hypothetical protein Gasu2_09540 [Galdieria sulphuraria]|nr:hypothetical protein Gasu2_09540 [Galdieria sulphuraria]
METSPPQDERDDSEELRRGFMSYSSSSENNSELQEDIDELIRTSRQVLRENGQTASNDFKVPYKYTKDQAIAKLQEIAKNFVIEHLPNRRNFDCPKQEPSDFLLQGRHSLLIQERESDSSEDELIVTNQPKRTLPSFSHLFMRKELRMKAKKMAHERQLKCNSKQIEEQIEVKQEGNSSESEGLDIQSQEDCVDHFDENLETTRETLETEPYYDTTDRRLKESVDSNQPETTTQLGYICHTKRTFGK